MVPFSLKAGRYWVTDPCYAYPKKEWGDFCNHLHDSPGVFAHGRRNFFVWSTAYGDGLYELNGPTTGTCGVDAGLLSLIPDALVKTWKAGKEMKRLEKMKLVVQVEIKDDFSIMESGGNIEFCGYSLKTDGSDLDEDDE
jgi:hypothetical protein